MKAKVKLSREAEVIDGKKRERGEERDINIYKRIYSVYSIGCANMFCVIHC